MKNQVKIRCVLNSSPVDCLVDDWFNENGEGIICAVFVKKYIDSRKFKDGTIADFWFVKNKKGFIQLEYDDLCFWRFRDYDFDSHIMWSHLRKILKDELKMQAGDCFDIYMQVVE